MMIMNSYLNSYYEIYMNLYKDSMLHFMTYEFRYMLIYMKNIGFKLAWGQDQGARLRLPVSGW